ncbi:MAG: DNA-3-methyladenine glycosylase 2 family protein [Actinobacteria bacterium]|jgi:DNA-3-methyladenine glycosylase II|nr:DNA-3-methyladenine glycosylase 2 family protein [Actinomycetota bacterium]
MQTITPARARSIAREIIAIDRRFEPVIKISGPSTIGQVAPKGSNFQSLAESILSQQLSIKAADTIITRVKALSGGRLSAEGIARLSDQSLRGAGCSSAKSRALRELAEATLDKTVPMRSLHRLGDDEIFESLTPLFGIGRWTVEMFLIFQLGRIDIWPVGDLGVRRGWEKIHRLEEQITPQELEKKGAKFAPYRSHVAWYCWRALSQ